MMTEDKAEFWQDLQRKTQAELQRTHDQLMLANAQAAAMRAALDAVVVRLSYYNAGSEEALQRLRDALATDVGLAAFEALTAAQAFCDHLTAAPGDKHSDVVRYNALVEALNRLKGKSNDANG